MTTNKYICRHGGLARKCEICERDDEIAELHARLSALREHFALVKFEPRQLASDAGGRLFVSDGSMLTYYDERDVDSIVDWLAKAREILGDSE